MGDTTERLASVQVYLTDVEKDDIHAAALRAGLTDSAYMRTTALKDAREWGGFQEPPAGKTFEELILDEQSIQSPGRQI